MTTKYAQGTEVSPTRSRDEIERTLQRFGATKQLWARDDELGRITVAFERQGRAYRIAFLLPPLSEFSTYVRQGRSYPTPRVASAATAAQQQEHRRLFRSLANYIKAMLAAVDDGIISAEEALLPYMMLKSGRTVSEEIELNIDRVLAGAPALPMLEGPRYGLPN